MKLFIEEIDAEKQDLLFGKLKKICSSNIDETEEQ